MTGRGPALALLAIAACSEPPPRTARTQEMVPANSLDEAKLPGAESPSLLDDAPPPEPAPPVAAPRADDAKPGAAVASRGAVAKADCDRAMDRFLELELETNPQLKGLPPEIVAQAKEQARQQHGEAPCTATPAQYRCAMAAKSTAAWRKCMK